MLFFQLKLRENTHNSPYVAICVLNAHLGLQIRMVQKTMRIIAPVLQYIGWVCIGDVQFGLYDKCTHFLLYGNRCAEYTFGVFNWTCAKNAHNSRIYDNMFSGCTCGFSNWNYAKIHIITPILQYTCWMHIWDYQLDVCKHWT